MKKFSEWYKEAEADIYETSPAQQYAKEILTDWKAQFELYYISARGHHVYDSTL